VDQHGKFWPLVIRTFFTSVTLVAGLFFANTAQASCRLALLLAIDVSSSVSDDEYAVMQKGLAHALLSDDVIQAILGSQTGHVALAAYEWSGRYQQNTLLDWHILDSRQAIQEAALGIASNTRSFSRYPTSMGFSLGFGAGLFQTAPRCERSVMDVSGDGINNDGFGPELAYRHFPFEGVTVNGLVIAGSDPDVEWFYESQVLRGRQAFLEIADGFGDFERAMTRKLYREISDVMIGWHQNGAASRPPRL